MKYRFFALILIPLLIASCSIKTPHKNSITGEVSRYGIYQRSGSIDYYPASNTATGYTVRSGAIHLSKTATFSLKKDLGFGFEYKIFNLPNDEIIKIEVIATHPPIINSEGVPYLVSQDVWELVPENGVIEDHLIYWLSNDNEMVPGKWVLEIRKDSKLLASKEFLAK